MFQTSIAQLIMIAAVIFMWTTMSLCACRIIEDLLENMQKMKQELKELKEQLSRPKSIVGDAVHIKTA
jgi:hypothetical protein